MLQQHKLKQPGQPHHRTRVMFGLRLRSSMAVDGHLSSANPGALKSYAYRRCRTKKKTCRTNRNTVLKSAVQGSHLGSPWPLAIPFESIQVHAPGSVSPTRAQHPLKGRVYSVTVTMYALEPTQPNNPVKQQRKTYLSFHSRTFSATNSGNLARVSSAALSNSPLTFEVSANTGTVCHENIGFRDDGDGSDGGKRGGTTGLDPSRVQVGPVQWVVGGSVIAVTVIAVTTTPLTPRNTIFELPTPHGVGVQVPG